MRGISDTNILDTFCLEFCNIIEKHSPYIVVSGFVAISSGRVRATEDIDMIVPRLSAEQFKQLHKDLERDFVCVQSDDADTIYDYLINNTAVRYTWKNEPLPEMEIKFVKDKLDEYQIQTKVKLDLTGLDIWFSSVEMNIAFKELLLKSEKDLKDAEHLRKVYTVDEKEVQHIKKLIREYRL